MLRPQPDDGYALECFDSVDEARVWIEHALESGTELTWSSRGNVGVNIIDRYKLLFFDNKLGKDIQVGLENIKTLVENSMG